MWKFDVLHSNVPISTRMVCRWFVLLLLSVLPIIGEADKPALSIESGGEIKDAPRLIVQVGVREDARPFSYETPTGSAERVLAGFSGYMINVCRHILKQMKTQPEYANLEFMSSKVSANKRFDDLNDNKVLFLCGPDSITDDLLDRFRPTLPVFLSGMTYAYLNPRSPHFPKGNYCGNVIGVVRGTTADKDGLRELIGKNMLMRFNKAVDLELGKQTEKNIEADKQMRSIIKEVIEEFRLNHSNLESDVESLNKILDDHDPERIHIDIDQLKNTKLSGLINKRMSERYKTINSDIAKTIEADKQMRSTINEVIEELRQNQSNLESDVETLNEVLDDRDPERIHINIDQLANTKLSGLINKRMSKRYKTINSDIAKTIQTDECPRGFDNMPIRKYNDHSDGVKNFCDGEVLYYLGDFDIINNKIREYSHCDAKMNRFTRTKEVYGVFFSVRDKYFACNPENFETLTSCFESAQEKNSEEQMPQDDITSIDVVQFRSEFNRLLFKAMQGKESAIERIFSETFIGQEKTADLHEFFQNFKISSFDE